MHEIKINEKDSINLERLIETRMLISCNSGGGKSFTLRKVLEQSHGKVQQIVLDMEGEFATLREKYDYVLIGKGGDLPADVRSAPLLAKKLLELNASAIIDLYELHQHERIRYVKLFLDAMVNADKALWHDCLVVLDEAHIFAPEKRESEAMTAVADIATRGRKRGFCLIAATQRLSKMNKDVAAELNNVLIGRTGLDIDMKRASESLGFTSKDQMLGLRSLAPGEFYAYGPAISDEVKKVKIGAVQTTHPKSGQRTLTASAPRSKVLSVLEKLKDLPQRAEEELREIEDYKRELSNLRRELTLQKRPGLSSEELKAIEEKAYHRGLNEAKHAYSKEIELVEHTFKNARKRLEVIKGYSSELLSDFEKNQSSMKDLDATVQFVQRKMQPVVQPKAMLRPQPIVPVYSEEPLDKCARTILSFLYHNHEAFDRKMVGMLTGYSHNSGGFKNAISRLNSLGLILKQGDMISISPMGVEKAPELLGSEIGLHKRFTIEGWKNQLPLCDSKIFSFLLENNGEHSREKIAEATGYSATSGGFKNSISHLHSLGLIVKVGQRICLREGILEEYA